MKRYPLVGKSILSFCVSLVFDDSITWDWTIQYTNHRWYIAEGNYPEALDLDRCRVFYEGLGISGPIISICWDSKVLIGELVTDKLTGSNSNLIVISMSDIYLINDNLPESMWNQAVQLAAFKWISERRSA